MEAVLDLEKRKKYKILIVDDSQTNIEFLLSILQQPDYIITSANNGNTALIKAKGNSFDLILLDVVMEGMDGFEVCKELKKNTSTKDVPIIFLTSLNDPNNISKGFEYGAVDYVKKPFNQSELKARVQTHLELKRSKDTIADKNKLLAETNRELEKLSIVASKTSNSVIIATSSGYVEWVNEGFTRLTGYTFDEIRQAKGYTLEEWSNYKDIKLAIDRSLNEKKNNHLRFCEYNKGRQRPMVTNNINPNSGQQRRSN